MCGLSFIYYKKNNTESLKTIYKMNSLIRHRGPDDEGYCVIAKRKPLFFKGDDTAIDLREKPHILECKENASIVMGHRRLAIVDESSHGHQPLYDKENGYILIFNGEIYNHGILRKKFENLGYVFKTHTDSEILIAAYHFDREDMLHCLDGMFAFILYDINKSKILMARDPFGIKPIYYRNTENSFSIVSEIKQLTALEDWKAIGNRKILRDFIQNGYQDHTHETMFNGVFQLPAGHYVYLDIGSLCEGPIKSQPYYVREKQKVPSSLNLAALALKKLLLKSVKDHSQGTLSLGMGFSGGLDSSSLLSCLLEENVKNFVTFSSISTHKDENEEKYIDHMITHHPEVKNIKIFQETHLSLDALKELTWVQDEPLYSPSLLAEASVFKKMKEKGIKVSLEGHGADELLNGYYEDIQSYLKTLWMKKKKISFLQEVFFICIKHLYLMKYVFKKIYKGVGPPSMISVYEKDDVTKERDLDKFQYSLYKQLHWSDRNSMCFSIEARVPFLEKDIVKFLMNTSDSFKFKYGLTKFLLRKAMKKNLPKIILRRKRKLGFPLHSMSVLLNHKENLAKALNNLMQLGLIQKHGPINDMDLIIKKENAYRLWRIFAVYLWVERFQVQL